MTYEKEFDIFSNNVGKAALTFHYHREFNERVYEDSPKQHNPQPNSLQCSKIFMGVDVNAGFWKAYSYSSIVCIIISLGRIFDDNKKSHGLCRMIKLAKKSNSFAKVKLRERVISKSKIPSDKIEDFMKRTHELSTDDFSDIEEYSKVTKEKWDSIKDIRNKIFAHQDMMDDYKKEAIFQKCEYIVFEEIIDRLLTIENIFCEAYKKGSKPDFTYKDTYFRGMVSEDVSKLLLKLAEK